MLNVSLALVVKVNKVAVTVAAQASQKARMNQTATQALKPVAAST